MTPGVSPHGIPGVTCGEAVVRPRSRSREGRSYDGGVKVSRVFLVGCVFESGRGTRDYPLGRVGVLVRSVNFW